jgi:hypothetical protein
MEDITAEVLRCRRIEVVDAAGAVRAVLGTVARDESDSVSLGLFAPSGREHLTVYCDAENAGLELWECGNNVATLASARDGKAGVLLSSSEGTPSAAFKNHGGPITIERPADFSLRMLRGLLRLKGVVTVKDA